MKRSETIEKIVKESYVARAKVLSEAAKDSTFNPDTVISPAQTATTASAVGTTSSSASGSSPGGGGGNSTVFAKVILLRKSKANLKKDDLILMTEKGREAFGKGKPAEDFGYFPFADEEKADTAKAVDPAFEDMPSGEKVKEGIIGESDVILSQDPFPGVDEYGAGIEEWVFAEEVPIEQFVIDKKAPGEQIVEGDLMRSEAQAAGDQVFNVYIVKEDGAPLPSDLILIKDNEEAVSSNLLS